jgi:hypothetical protein
MSVFRIILYVFILSPFLVSAQGKKFFDKGKVELKNPIERIDIDYVNDWPLMKVQINGKNYRFLFDTGAPTVISNAVFNELNLKKTESNVSDSHGIVKKQAFTRLPEMQIGAVLFKDIGCVVMDLTYPEFACFGIDGIIGANQMAKLFWKVDYLQGFMDVTTDLMNFDLQGFDFVIPFQSRIQKTPLVEVAMLNETALFTFDTGSSGGVILKQDDFNVENQLSEMNYVTVLGTHTGAYGRGEISKRYLVLMDTLLIGEHTFENKIVQMAAMNNIGNKFLKDFAYILDWKNEKIYLKNTNESLSELRSFGFGYLFADNKPVMLSVHQDEGYPLQLGDEILSINNISLENLDEETACGYYIHANQ